MGSWDVIRLWTNLDKCVIENINKYLDISD